MPFQNSPYKISSMKDLEEPTSVYTLHYRVDASGVLNVNLLVSCAGFETSLVR